MRYMNLAEIKRQLNIDEFYCEEDEFLESLGVSAEEIVEQQINCKLSEVTNDADELPESLKSAMRLLVEHLYANRGSDTNDLPPAFYYICKLYRRFD